MKRFHVHVAVHDLEQSIRFYSSLFGAAPSVTKNDYAKWMLDDPRVNFAISTRGAKPGLDHLGLQAETEEELEEIGVHLAQADVSVMPQKGAACCYAKSDKYWTIDPAARPPGPASTSSRNIFRRESCASAARASMAFLDSTIPE